MVFASTAMNAEGTGAWGPGTVWRVRRQIERLRLTAPESRRPSSTPETPWHMPVISRINLPAWSPAWPPARLLTHTLSPSTGPSWSRQSWVFPPDCTGPLVPTARLTCCTKDRDRGPLRTWPCREASCWPSLMVCHSMTTGCLGRVLPRGSCCASRADRADLESWS